MKYEIKGIEKGKTIKSVQVVDGAKLEKRPSGMLKTNSSKLIMVDYLDGTQDVFEFDEKTINRIQNIVDAQASCFVSVESEKMPLWGEFNYVFSGACILIALNLLNSIIGMAICCSGAIIFLGNGIRIKLREKSLKKHIIYEDKIQGKLEEYRNILEKEKHLSKTNSKQHNEMEPVINIDNKSIKELEYIGNKIERYNEIDDKNPKVKTL